MKRESSIQDNPGYEVVEEAVHLLAKLQFDAHSGTSAEGKHVLVNVTPTMSSGQNSIRVLVTCYAYAHRRVDWSTLRIIVQQKGSNRHPVSLFPLLKRGQASLQGLEPAGYSVFAYHRTQQPYQILRSKRAEHTLAADSPPERPLDKPLDRPRTVYRSEDLTATLSPSEIGVRVDFETANPRHEGARVEFCFVAPETGDILVSDRVILQRIPAEQLWLGTWEGAVGPEAIVEFAHRLVSE
ncbi:MAG: hypothetical protein ABFS45_17445 [Pseudomonadota bacterium]